MRICIVVEVDEEIADPQHSSGLTRQAYEQLTDAITSVVGGIIRVSRDV